MLSSVLSLLPIPLDRYFSICLLLKDNEKVAFANHDYFVLISWLILAVLSIVMLVAYKVVKEDGVKIVPPHNDSIV